MAREPSSITRTGAYEPFDLQVARGQITYHTPVNIFGFQNAITTTSTTVWENATAYTLPSSAAVLTIVSTSASDGTSLSVVISGLDANYDPISETIALNGLSAVTSVKSYLRVNSVICTNGLNVGTVTFKQGANIVAQMNPSIGKNQAALYSVPAGFTLYLSRFSGFSSEAGGSNNYTTWSARYSNAVTGQTFVVAQSPFTNAYTIQRITPYPVLEKFDVQWQLSAGTGTHPVGVNIEGILIKNDAGVP